MNTVKYWIICVFAVPCLSAQAGVDARTQTTSLDFSGVLSAKAGRVLPAICWIGASFFKSNAPVRGYTATDTSTFLGAVTAVFGRNAAVTAQNGDL